jgi:hypothetical protein
MCIFNNRSALDGHVPIVALKGPKLESPGRAQRRPGVNIQRARPRIRRAATSIFSLRPLGEGPWSMAIAAECSPSD